MQYKNDITFETTLYYLDDHHAGIFLYIQEYKTFVH